MLMLLAYVTETIDFFIDQNILFIKLNLSVCLCYLQGVYKLVQEGPLIQLGVK